jgi:hypothetical protein
MSSPGWDDTKTGKKMPNSAFQPTNTVSGDVQFLKFGNSFGGEATEHGRVTGRLSYWDALEFTCT